TVLLPWWHIYWAPCFWWLTKQFKKAGIEVIFLCHNADDHEHNYLKRALSNLVLSNANRFIVHSKSDRNNLAYRFPSTPIEVTPMPVFSHFPPPRIELPRRRRVELLFFGFVRPYKG